MYQFFSFMAYDFDVVSNSLPNPRSQKSLRNIESIYLHFLSLSSFFFFFSGSLQYINLVILLIISKYFMIFDEV